MALSFPSSPQPGDTYLSYIWDGVKWGVQAGVGGVAGVSSLNTRTGSLTLLLADVTGATGSGSTAQASLGLAKVAATGAYSDLSGAPSGGTAGVSSFNTRTGDVTLSSADVTGALTFTPYNATNPSGYQTAAQVTTALAPYAPLASPTFTGTPAAPTVAAADNSTTIATTAFVKTAVGAGGGIAEAPSDGSSYGRLNAAWAKVAPLASPTFTGQVRLPAGVTATPSLNFGNTDTGIYGSGSGASAQINFSRAGGNALVLQPSIIVAYTPIAGASGTAAAPSYSFITSPSMGMYRDAAASALGFSTGSNGVGLLLTNTGSTATFYGVASGVSPPAGATATELVTAAWVTTAVAPAANNVGRNLIHNALFNIQQRGAGPWTALASYTADRWLCPGVSDTISITVINASDASRAAIGDEAAAFNFVNAFTGSAVTGAYNTLQQAIEGVRRLAGKTVTLSFWAACATGALKVGINYLQHFGTGGAPSSAAWINTTGQSVTLSTTWTRYSITTAIPSAAGKTLGTNGNDCTYLGLAFSSGAGANALFGNVGVQTGTVNLWGVQLEIGSTATPLEKPDPQVDLAKCQRFYQTGQITSATYSVAGAAATLSDILPVTMRATPTMAVTGNFNGNISGFTLGATQPNAGTSATSVLAQGTVVASGGVTYNFTFSASADL